MAASATENEKKFHRFMYTLLYPAVLGTMLVGVVFSVTEDRLSFDNQFFWAVFLVFYFSSQHVENVDKENSYKAIIFIFDIIEVLCLMGLFLLLNVYKFPYSVNSNLGCTWDLFFCLLVTAFLIPIISRYLDKREIFKSGDGRGQTIHSVIAVLITVSGFFLYTDMHWIMIILLSLVFLSYLVALVFDATKIKEKLGLPKSDGSR